MISLFCTMNWNDWEDLFWGQCRASNKSQQRTAIFSAHFVVDPIHLYNARTSTHIVGGQEKPPKSPKSTSLGLLSIRSRSIPSPLWFNWLIFVSLPLGRQPLSCHEFPATFNPWQNPAILPKPWFGFPAPPKLPGTDGWDEWHRSQFFRWSHINGDLWQWDSSSECGEDPGAWDTKGSRGNETLLAARCDGSMFGQSENCLLLGLRLKNL